MTASTSRKRARKARTSARERIATVARDLFVAQGFAAVSVDEIARCAQVSKPTIYAHFGDKERLFLDILETACARLIAPLVSEDARGKPIAEVLHNHALHYARAVLDPEVIALHRLCVGEAKRFPMVSQHYFERGPRTANKALAAFLRERADAGEIHCPDCELAAWHYAALVIATERTRLLFHVDEKPDWAEIDQQTRAAVDLFLRGVLGHASWGA